MPWSRVWAIDKRCLLAVFGYVVMLMVPAAPLALVGILLIGFGVSNAVTFLFRRAVTQTAMPAGLSIVAVTTIGYERILAGSARMDFVAGGIWLAATFWLLAVLLCLVPLCARAATSLGAK
jgi:hypothetical protein